MRNIQIKSIVVLCSMILTLTCFSLSVAAGKININTATVAQLTELNGIGEKTAEKIVAYRSQKKFASVEELSNVKGIGEKTLLKLKDQLTVDEKPNQ